MNTIQYSNNKSSPGIYIPDDVVMMTFSVMRDDGIRGFVSIPVSIELLRNANDKFGAETVKMATDALAVANDAINPNKGAFTHF